MAPSTLSFRPPTLTAPYAAGSASLRTGSPDEVLLHKLACISNLQNTTTAFSKTKDGQPVEVSFWLVDPPGVSYFSVHCPGLKEDDFVYEPYVVCADAALVLLLLALNIPGGSSFHYFVYRAGPGEPALHLLTCPGDGDEPCSPDQLGLMPCGGDRSEHYAVVLLTQDFIGDDFTWQFGVDVFSSQTQAWSRKEPLVRLSESDYCLLADHVTKKQIKVGRSSLCWVDPLYGILLLRNIFQDDPVIEYIKYPEEASKPWITEEECVAAQYFRDVTCCDNLIKFVHVEYLGPDRSPFQVWEATTWNMNISENLWRERLTVHVDNISVDQSYSCLLPELWDDKTQKLELNKMIFYTPTLSRHDDDLLYVMSRVNDEDDKAWVITVDMKQSAVQAVASFTAKNPVIPTYYLCSFPKYLRMTRGADMANPGHSCFKMMDAKRCALEVLSTQGWLRELDQWLESQRSRFIGRRLLRRRGLVSSLCLSIRAVVDSCDDQGKAEAASKAVDVCLRALEDLDLLLRWSLTDPSISTVAIRSKISLTLQALDNVSQIAAPAMMTRGTGHQEGKTTSESDAKLLSDNSKMGHTKDKRDKLQQVRSSGKETRRKKRNQVQHRKNLKHLLLFAVPRMTFCLLVVLSFVHICYLILVEYQG